MGLQCNRRLERRWSRKGLVQVDVNNSKRFEMQKFIVYINLYMKSELTEKQVRRTISRICANIKTRWNTLRIENRKSSQIVKIQQEEQAHKEKMHELNERLKQQEEKIQKRDEAFEASKREQARVIKQINDEIASKAEKLDLERIEDRGFGKEKQRYVMVPEKDFDDWARRANPGPLMHLLKDFKDHILGLGIVKRLRATIAKLKEEMADLMRTNDRLTKDLQYVIEDRNKYKYQLKYQEYYLTDEERDEIAEKIIQRKDLELEDRDRTFDRDDLDLSR